MKSLQPEKVMDESVSPVRDATGAVTGASSVGRDITEQRRTEEALRASEERYRSLVVATAQVVWTTDPEGEVEDMPLWRYLTGQTREEVRGFGWLQAVHPDDRQRTDRAWRQAVAHKAGYDVEYRVRRHDGEYRHMWARGVPVMEADGQTVREWVGTCTDITDRKRVEEELRKQMRDAAIRAKLAEIFLAVRDEEMYAEVLGVVLEAMQSAVGVFGYVDEDGALVEPSMTRGVWEKCQVANKDIVFPRNTWGNGSWCRAIREKTTVCCNRPAKVPAGHIPIRRNVAVPILFQGESIGLLQVANKETDYDPEDIALLESIAGMIAPILIARLQRDRSEKEQKRYAAELELSNAELQDFASIASHDLQEPLRKVIAFGEHLRQHLGSNLDELGNDFLARMQNAAHRMSLLIDALLEYSRVTTRAHPFQPVDLTQVLFQVLADVEQRIAQSRARVEFVPLPKVMADVIQVRQLLQNLVANALKFQPPHASPHLRIDGHDNGNGWCQIRVRDNGIGFDEKYLDRIFRPFQRLHGRGEYPGSGMGLAICRKVVARHGGTLTAHSRPGEGSTFVVTLPAANLVHKESGTTWQSQTQASSSASCSPKTMTTTSS